MSGSVDLIAAKQDLESSWHLFFIKHTYAYLLIHLYVHVHDLGMHIVAQFVQRKQNKSLRTHTP